MGNYGSKYSRIYSCAFFIYYFQEVCSQAGGQVKSARILYDASGRSEGKAAVVFENHTDAVNAVNVLNGALLDNRPMHVEFPNPADFQASKPSFQPARGNGNQQNKQQGNRQKNNQGNKKQGRGGKADRPPRAPKEKKEPGTHDNLNADLDSYFGTADETAASS